MFEKDRKSILTRMYIIYFLMFAIGLAIIWKTVDIQFVEGEMWKEKAEKLHLRHDSIEPIRGNIFSSDGSLLAASVPVFEIRMDVASPHISDAFFYEKIDSLALCLSKLFGNKTTRQYKEDLKSARTQKDRFFLIKRNVTFSQLKQLRKFPIFNLGKYRGGLIEIQRTRRVLPLSNLAFRTIGWDKPGTKNDVGLEGAYSTELSGSPGKRIAQKIGNGIWRPINDAFEIEPQNGNDLITTIDAVIQDVANEALRKQLNEQEADHGCAILMDVKTGHIIAIVNLTKTEDGNYEERKNHAIYESSEPGSTFKLASVIAALEDEVTNPDMLIETGNGIQYYSNRKMVDTHHGGYGTITLREAFEVSSNVGISKMIYDAYNPHPEKFIDRLHSMSLNNTLGLDIAGEGLPYIKHPSDKTWSKVSLPWMSIGYELKITPLQTLAFYNAIANGGCMVKPIFVKEIRRTGQTIKHFDPVIINPAIASPQTIAIARKLLEGVVENGTAKNLKSNLYKIAGKTGTAQIADGSKGYNKSNYKASFVGYFPADDPQYSGIVVINNPQKGGYYGGTIAAPVFKEIADRVYAGSCRILQRSDTSYNVTDTLILSGSREDITHLMRIFDFGTAPTASGQWIDAMVANATVNAGERTIDITAVPDVTGMTARDAIYILEKAGMRVKIEGKGLVISQSQSPGTLLESNMEIELNLAI